MAILLNLVKCCMEVGIETNKVGHGYHQERDTFKGDSIGGKTRDEMNNFQYISSN